MLFAFDELKTYGHTLSIQKLCKIEDFTDKIDLSFNRKKMYVESRYRDPWPATVSWAP